MRPLRRSRAHDREPASFQAHAIVATSRYTAIGTVLLVTVLLITSWLIAYLAGGSQTMAPHLLYFPVVLASARFGVRGSLVAGGAATLLAGPFLPLDVAAGVAQVPLNWLLRGVIYIFAGLMTGYAAQAANAAISADLARRVVRRDLRQALEQRYFHLVYQPVIDLTTNQVIGAEALLRWTDPERGPRFPDEFIPAIEDAGMIGEVSSFVLGAACDQLANWTNTALLDTESDFKLAINISGLDLQDDHLEQRLRQTIAESGVNPVWLSLEVTETALIADLDTAIAGLQRLRGTGVRLAIDDFGVGESSLRYLHRFPVTTVKIDRSFIEALVNDDRGILIVGSVVSMAETMGLTTIAEGVETAEQANVLRSIGCPAAQGYHFARPLSPSNFEQFVTTRRPPIAVSPPSPTSPASPEPSECGRGRNE